MTQQLRKFVVDDSGLVYDASYNPKLREDLYDVDPYPFKTSRDVESAVEEIPPLLSVLGEAYQDEMACPYTDPIEKEEKWPEWDPGDEGFFEDWYPRLTESDLVTLNEMVGKWLKEEPSWNWEEDYFQYPRDGGVIAFSFLEDLYHSTDDGEEIFERLGIELMDGVHPGNDSRIAQMSCEPQAANQICAELGIPIHFELKA